MPTFSPDLVISSDDDNSNAGISTLFDRRHYFFTWRIQHSNYSNEGHVSLRNKHQKNYARIITKVMLVYKIHRSHYKGWIWYCLNWHCTKKKKNLYKFMIQAEYCWVFFGVKLLPTPLPHTGWIFWSLPGPYPLSSVGCQWWLRQDTSKCHDLHV